MVIPANGTKPKPAMIEKAFGNKHVVRLRQKLGTEELADQFILDLSELISAHREQGKTLVIEDLDLSENKIPTEQLEAIFNHIVDGAVHVERLRCFGMATLDDTVAITIAGWLAGVATENVPYEMHLSDCALTEEGFGEIIRAIEENDTFPAPDPRHPSKGKLPVYIRVENNYIESSAIQQFIDGGVITKMLKGDIVHSDTHKVRLLSSRDRGFQQRTGPPPAPEDARAPRPYRGKGAGKSLRTDAVRPWHQRSTPTSMSGRYPTTHRVASSLQPASRTQAMGSRVASSAPWKAAPYDAFSARTKRAAGDEKFGDVKRSRVDTTRRDPKGAGKGAGKAPGGRLPPGWEEHWSDEYKLNYYWNSKTGESSWEKPGGSGKIK